MNRSFGHQRLAALGFAAALFSGCGPRTTETTAAHEGEGSHEEHGHAHEEEGEAAAGASFTPGKGVFIAPETREILGLEVAAVVEEPLAARIRFTAQIFDEKHHHVPNPADHSGCDVHGSGLVADDVAQGLKPGDPVQVETPAHPPLHGVVLAVQKAVALGESEVVVGISNATSLLRPGEFVPASITHPAGAPFPTVPRSALLRSSEGTFVYTLNGDAYLRTPVRLGPGSGERLAVTNGLRAGDRVVTRPVESLWLIELRATKGGGHSH